MKKSKKSQAKESGNRVLVNFILDKSGSMGAVQDETIHGFNKYIDELKKEKGGCLFSLTLFDTSFSSPHIAEPLDNIKPLDKSSFAPSGCTALYDAIGRTVANIEREKPKVDKVLTVIQTDGHENSSREWSFQRVRELIERKEKEGNWTFVFLGATLDAFDIGVQLGVQKDNAMRYDPQHTGAVYASLARSTNVYRISPQAATARLVDDENLGSGLHRR